MKGDPLENAKIALLSSLSKLNSEDSFNIIAFNGETYLFSSLMKPATKEEISKAIQWLDDKLTASGGTNIMAPLKQVCIVVVLSLKICLKAAFGLYFGSFL